jgi:hypothetical protein
MVVQNIEERSDQLLTYIDNELSSRSPFLSVPELNVEDALFLYDFLKPPTRQTLLVDRRKKRKG